MKRAHTQKAMILLILYCIIAFPHFAFGQNGNQSPPSPPFDERLPNDECERLWGIGRENQFDVNMRIALDKNDVVQCVMIATEGNEKIMSPDAWIKIFEIQDATGGHE